MSESAPATLAALFAQHLIERDAPPHRPARSPRGCSTAFRRGCCRPRGCALPDTHRCLARMLVAPMEHPERNTQQLQLAAGLQWRAGSRMAAELVRRGLYFYYRLTRAAEDALVVVAGATS